MSKNKTYPTATEPPVMSTTAPAEVHYVHRIDPHEKLHDELRTLFREIIEGAQRLHPGNVSHQKAGVISVAMYGLDLLKEKSLNLHDGL